MIACVKGVAVTEHDEVRLERGRAGRLWAAVDPTWVRPRGGAALRPEAHVQGGRVLYASPRCRPNGGWTWTKTRTVSYLTGSPNSTLPVAGNWLRLPRRRSRGERESAV
jgi:hypothetical protein